MKKKVFSLLATGLFMVSSFNLNAYTNIEKEEHDECWQLANTMQATYEAEMLKLHKIPSHLESFKVWEEAYLGCI